MNFKISKVFCARKFGRPHLKNAPILFPKNVRTGNPSSLLDRGRLFIDGLLSKQRVFIVVCLKNKWEHFYVSLSPSFFPTSRGQFAERCF